MRKAFPTFMVLIVLLAVFLAASRLNLFNSRATASAEDPARGRIQHDTADLRALAELIKDVKTYYLEGRSVTTEDLVVAAAKGMIHSLDEHSSFHTGQEYERLLAERLRGNYAGIGAYVNLFNGYFTIVRPIYSGPAYAAGLRSRDRIVEVNGKSIVSKPLEDSINLLRGKVGKTVNVKVMRRGWTKPREFTIRRAVITIHSVRYEMLPAGIGLVHISTFGDKTAMELETALQALEHNGMKALIIDLRRNTGGLFSAALSIVDKFLPAGKLIVYSQGRKDSPIRRRDYYSTKAIHPNYPLVILVNEFSASASEILSGSLQDHKRATIVGVTTYGKGSIQQVLSVRSMKGARLKLTTAKYFLPSGRSIHKIGVKPDVQVAEAEPEPWWELQEIQNVIDKHAVEAYLKEHYKTNEKLLHTLAEYDGKDPNRYPDFDKWYAALNTKASRDTVRRALRQRLRTRISDERKREFSYNLQTDLQLQRGILTVLEKQKIDPNAIAQYRLLALGTKPFAKSAKKSR